MARTNSLSTFSLGQLFAHACGRRTDDKPSDAKIWQLSAGSVLGALVMAALWGAMAGSDSISHAARNIIAVPLVVLLSSLCAIPAGIIGLKLSGVEFRARDLLLSFASAIFGGTMLMATLAPLAAIYFHTSAEVGNQLAMLSVLVAVAVGSLLFFRGVLARIGEAVQRRYVLVSSVVIVAIQLAAMLQFIALASPILPGGTFLDGGYDGLSG